MCLIPLVYLVALLITATSGLIRYWDPSWLQSPRLQTFNLYQRLEQRIRTADKVVIFDIDEQSLAPSCQWPWLRSVIAELLDKITSSTAAFIGFNVIFTELDRCSPQQLQATLPHLDPDTRAKLLTLPNNDDLLAEDHLVGTSGRAKLAVIGSRAGAAHGRKPLSLWRNSGDRTMPTFFLTGRRSSLTG
jgi:hypothetical protein